MTDELARQWPDFIQRIRERTPARVLSGRSGASYRTNSQLELREAHAAAADAVRDELELAKTLGSDFFRRWKLFEAITQAASKSEYLLRPDKGRALSFESRAIVKNRCEAGVSLQIVIGDGLSVAAVRAQVPRLLPLLMTEAAHLGWRVGQPFVIRHCRVGVLNEIGELLSPQIAVLLIGERPGLATSESLSAYLAFHPRAIHTDADRNLISNIHARGTPIPAAAKRIVDLATAMMSQQISGTKLRTPVLDDNSS